MTKNEILARSLNAAGLMWSVGQIGDLGASHLRILAYHRIWDLDDDQHFPFDVELISASTREFAWQMEYISQNFSPVTFAQVASHLDGGVPLPRRPIVVTFDDGFDDNYHQATPILQAYGVPATFFLSTGYIGGDETYWYDQLVYAVMTAEPERLTTLASLNLSVSPVGGTAERRQLAAALLGRLKLVPNQLRTETCQRVHQELGVPQPVLHAFSRPMNWSQARAMRDVGMEFGSHTVTHPILKQTDDADLAFELRESKATLERELGIAVQALSYPVGGRAAFDQRVEQAASEAGYRFACNYMKGINPLAKLDRYSLHRVHVERTTSRAMFAASAAMPNVFGW